MKWYSLTYIIDSVATLATMILLGKVGVVDNHEPIYSSLAATTMPS